MDGYQRLNVAIMPQEGLTRRVIEMAKKFPIKGQYFAVDGVNYLPHATLYLTEFRNDKLGFVEEAVANICQNIEKFEVEFEKFIYESGYIKAKFETTQSVWGLHEMVVKGLLAYRMAGVERENVLKYGHPFVMAKFRPNVTLGRYEDEEVGRKVFETVKATILESLQVAKIAICQAGMHGTCVRVLVEYELK